MAARGAEDGSAGNPATPQPQRSCHFSLSWGFYSLVQAERELALGGRTCSSEGHLRAGPGLGSVSGQQGTPAFAGDAVGVLQHQALRPQEAPLRLRLTQEQEAFQLQGLVGRLLGLG